jgi:hypothetical protein
MYCRHWGINSVGADVVFQNFVGRVLNLDSAGELTLERVPLRGVAQQAGGPPGGREPEYFSTVSVT